MIKNINDIYGTIIREKIFKNILDDLNNKFILTDSSERFSKTGGKEKLIEEIKKYSFKKINEKALYNHSFEENYDLYIRNVSYYNNKLFNSMKLKSDLSDYRKLNQNQVFLSYSVKDKYVALLLFFYFQNKNIFLYVDFFFNKNTINIKNNLALEMNKSNQFLFLDSPNSQIKIDSNTYIRPWCSWENGYFSKKVNNKNKNIFRLGWAKLVGNSMQVEMLKK